MLRPSQTHIRSHRQGMYLQKIKSSQSQCPVSLNKWNNQHLAIRRRRIVDHVVTPTRSHLADILTPESSIVTIAVLIDSNGICKALEPARKLEDAFEKKHMSPLKGYSNREIVKFEEIKSRGTPVIDQKDFFIFKPL